MSPLSARGAISRMGAVASIIVVGFFLLGMIGIVTVLLDPGAPAGWWTLLEENWLVVLFKRNMGLPGSLGNLNLLDLGIMALFCVIALALFKRLHDASKIGALIAAVLPFLGIPMFILTGTAGRSTLLISGLIISVVMLRGQEFSKGSAYMGIVASGLLFFAGDIATAIFSRASIIALFIGVGYSLWMIWFALIASNLAVTENNPLAVNNPVTKNEATTR